MKEIRQINKVSSPDHDEINNEKDDMFPGDTEPGCYQQVISSMLAPSHGNKLISWLKKQTCKQTIDGNCTDLMQLRSTHMDGLCASQSSQCLNRKSIRTYSKLTNATQMLLEWCKGNDIETVANNLGIGNSIVEEVYVEASYAADKCMRSNIADWQLGGPGVVVIIDTYPEGCANTNLIRVGRPILCISEIKSIPQKYWLETLDHFQVNNDVQIADLKRHIIRTVRTIVRPGSILITPLHSMLCSHSDFDCLRTLYPTIVNTRALAKHDDEEQTLFSNLGTIWKSVLDVCEIAQFYSSSLIPQFIISHMWRRRYGDDSLELLLYELSVMQ